MEKRLRILVLLSTVIRIVERTFKEYNEKELNPESHHYQSIKRTFDKVGQNPWSEDTEAFEKHLEALSLDSMYKCLNDNHTAAKLDQLRAHID